MYIYMVVNQNSFIHHHIYKPYAVNIFYVYTHRIHGAGIYANMTGVYGWDPCYHIYIYSSTMDPSWDIIYI